MAEFGFFGIDPAPKVNRITCFVPFNNVEQFLLVFKFFGMFPADKLVQIFTGKPKVLQFAFRNAANNAVFHISSHLPSLHLHHVPNHENWSSQGK